MLRTICRTRDVAVANLQVAIITVPEKFHVFGDFIRHANFWVLKDTSHFQPYFAVGN